MLTRLAISIFLLGLAIGEMQAGARSYSDSVRIYFEIDPASGLKWFDVRKDYVFNINNTLVIPDTAARTVAVNPKGPDHIKSYGPIEEFLTCFRKGASYIIRFMDKSTVVINPMGGENQIGAFKFNVQNFAKNRYVGVYKEEQKMLSTSDVKTYETASHEPGIPGLPQYFLLGSVTDKRDFPQHISKLCTYKFAFLHGERISLNYYTWSRESGIKVEGYVD